VYFFHVDSEPNPEPYPVVPNFRAWVFPHDGLPYLWDKSAQSAVAIGPRTATETCRLTNKRLACENAHIIPSAEKSWFADNEMDRYGELGGRTGQDVADSPANSIRLRRDVHILWDSLFFSVVPKESQDGENDGTRWCAHSMVQDEELFTDYHNRPTESLTGRAVEYSMHALHGISFRRSLAFFKAHSQGDLPSDERMAKWRCGLSLHKSARSSLETRVGDAARAPPKEVVGLMARCTSIPTV
jgi:hypothetical protein